MTKEELIQAPQYKQLTTLEKEIAVASLEQKIRDMEYNVFLTGMLGLIGKTYLNCGYDLSKNKDQIDLTIDELCRDLQKYNGLLSFSEIQIAFNKGYKQEYGEFYGLNNATYFGWVNAYTWNEHRINAKKAIEAAKNKPAIKPEISEDQKEEIVKKGVLKMFEDYKAGSVILDPGNVVYNYLDKKGKIPFTAERKNKFIAEAKEQMIQAAIQNKGVKPIAKVIEDATKSKDVIIANAKREALKEYFKNLFEIESELDLN